MDQEKQKILAHFPDSFDQELASNIYDKLERVRSNHTKEKTDFLDPHQLELVEKVSNNFVEVAAFFHGGLPGSKRNKCIFYPKSWNWTPQMKDLGIQVLEIEGKFEFEPIHHRDVLGAVLSLGIKREKVGDIITGKKDEAGFIYIALDFEISRYVADNLIKIKNTGVSLTPADQEALPYLQEYTKEVSGTVSSLRLDSVASIGFGASRSKMNQLIKAERLKLNWKPVKDPKIKVASGDTISLKGKGRVKVASVGGKSRKGRIHVLMQRYKS